MKASAASLHLLRTDPLSAARDRAALPHGSALGLIHAQPCATATLALPTPWRWAVLCAWTDVEAVRSLDLGRRHVAPALTLVPRQVRGSWRGIEFQAEPNGRDDEEVVAFVYGRLRPRHVPEFFRRNLTLAAAARASDGLLSGIGLFESPLRFASFSRWQSTAALREYAYGPGRHRDVISPYKTVPWADEHAAIRFAVV